MGYWAGREDRRAAIEAAADRVALIIGSTSDRDLLFLLYIQETHSKVPLVGLALLSASRRLGAMHFDHPLYGELFMRLARWELEQLEEREWRPG